ncbi:MAG: phage tail tube protein [Clostridiales bacterium]
MNYLKIDEVVNGKMGEVYITIGGKMTELVGIQKIEAHDTINERTLKTVGTIKIQTAPAGVDGSGTMTLQYGHIKIFSGMVATYRKTGKMPRFDLTIINNDPAPSLGRRSASFIDCCLSGDVGFAALDADSDDGLTIEINFKYSDSEIMDDFNDFAEIGRE